jgi:hypothetical protein
LLLTLCCYISCCFILCCSMLYFLFHVFCSMYAAPCLCSLLQASLVYSSPSCPHSLLLYAWLLRALLPHALRLHAWLADTCCMIRCFMPRFSMLCWFTASYFMRYCCMLYASLLRALCCFMLYAFLRFILIHAFFFSLRGYAVSCLAVSCAMLILCCFVLRRTIIHCS